MILHQVLADLAHVDGLAAPTPTDLNTDGVLAFIATRITPILIAIVGIVMLGRANKGEVSKAMTSSAIAILGLIFVAGAATLFFAGDFFVKLLFK